MDVGLAQTWNSRYKEMALGHTFSIIIADYISSKVEHIQFCNPWREWSWRYAHDFLLLFLFSDVLHLCNSALGLAEVRLGKTTGNITDEQETEQVQVHLLSFFPVGQQFHLSQWISKKEQLWKPHKGELFFFITERHMADSHKPLYLTDALLPRPLPGPGRRPPPSNPLRVTMTGFWLGRTQKWRQTYKREYLSKCNW